MSDPRGDRAGLDQTPDLKQAVADLRAVVEDMKPKPWLTPYAKQILYEIVTFPLMLLAVMLGLFGMVGLELGDYLSAHTPKGGRNRYGL